LGNIYSTIRGINSNVNSLLFIDGWINREIKLDTRIVFEILCKLYIKELGSTIGSGLIYIQYNTIKTTRNVTI